MRFKSCFFLIIILLSSPLYSNDYLLPTSDKLIISKKAIENKTKNFYRYARNEIFARKGYQFKDTDLALFFKNTNWYIPQNEVKIELSEIEKINVNTLKLLEQSTTIEPFGILFKYNYNSMPLFYIGVMQKEKFVHLKGKWRRGKFILLDKNYMWALNCETIPTEFIINNAIHEVCVYDYGRALTEDQISLNDLDKKYTNNSGIEIKINLMGPSDDAEVVYLGLNKNNEFIKFFSIPSGGFISEHISDTKMLIKAAIRKNLHGTSFYEQKYIFDTISKKLYAVPDLMINHKYPDRVHKCKTKLNVYYDARSAVKKQELAKIGEINLGTLVVFIKYYRAEGKGSANIKYVVDGKEYTGWLNQQDVGPYNFEGMYFAD